MKNLKKLSRNELKNLRGGGGPFDPETNLDPVTCHYHYTESSNGSQTVTHLGSGGCGHANSPKGTKCYSYVAMGGSCYE
ncbi:bacteriocin-like protein [Chryseobacterium sp. GP-SGM7]|uniref:bacteriocin-like protein n=1 Tax=Chryseobacterium sp. GP-SGM7 TaxID=3411323 RepID=UPI003B924AAE